VKKWGKNPLTLGWGANAHLVKRQEDLGGQNLRAQIYGQGWIPEPPCHSTFKVGGGGPELDAHLSTVWIGEPRSTVKVGF
jgi:hypothetical protein